ncbi:MAG: MoxR family ATPase [Myxococcales bacterium]|nr:MoxR family ATPase [Myxococcales bacterium]
MDGLADSPAAASRLAARIADRVEQALVGKRDVVELAVATLFAGGHLLVEDVPGVGKTTLARALAASVGVGFRRVQFTSDLLPADVLGGNVYDPRTGAFAFHRGPVFTHVLLADEINRASPRTQSALLEAMDERQVSIDGTTHPLEEPFFVVATQNPEEFHGTHPLPESQLDRFLLRVRIGYPPEEVERGLLRERRGSRPLSVEPVTDRQTLLAALRAVEAVHVAEPALAYLHAIVLGTRRSPRIELGASTRAALSLERAARALALVRGRDHVLPDDVQDLVEPVLAHRLRVAGAFEPTHERREAAGILRELVSTVPVPL